MVTDPIGDFIIRLKNASMVRHATCELPYSALKHAIAEKLREAGYVKETSVRGKTVKKTLALTLSYAEDGTPKIQGVERISKPGRRMYRGNAEIFPVKYGRGLLMLSTPKGVLTGEEAKRENVGGEALFKIW